MNELTPNNLNHISKPEIEAVEQEKQEYKLIGKYMRRPGLKLFQYDHLKDEVIEVETDKKKDLHIKSFSKEKVFFESQTEEEAIVDGRFEHFESLNMANAINRVNKYKSGWINELCNLREPKSSIKIF